MWNTFLLFIKWCRREKGAEDSYLHKLLQQQQAQIKDSLGGGVT